MLIHEVPLHEVYVSVWCAKSEAEINKSLFSEAINWYCYVTHILLRSANIWLWNLYLVCCMCDCDYWIFFL